MLSRLPGDRSSNDDDSFVKNAFCSDLSAFTVEEVEYASKQDEVLVKVRDFIFIGWPRRSVMDEKTTLLCIS